MNPRVTFTGLMKRTLLNRSSGPINTPARRADSGAAEDAPAERWVIHSEGEEPWAMVVPNGVALAASGSTWMNR